MTGFDDITIKSLTDELRCPDKDRNLCRHKQGHTDADENDAGIPFSNGLRLLCRFADRL